MWLQRARQPALFALWRDKFLLAWVCLQLQRAWSARKFLFTQYIQLRHLNSTWKPNVHYAFMYHGNLNQKSFGANSNPSVPLKKKHVDWPMFKVRDDHTWAQGHLLQHDKPWIIWHHSIIFDQQMYSPARKQTVSLLSAKPQASFVSQGFMKTEKLHDHYPFTDCSLNNVISGFSFSVLPSTASFCLNVCYILYVFWVFCVALCFMKKRILLSC